MKNTALVIEQTKQWLKRLVIDHNLCPFAHKEYARNSIHYACVEEHQEGNYYDNVVEEIERLIAQPEISTSLLIWPLVQSFEEFLSFVGMAEQILLSHGWHRDFQLAHFHPEYCFDDSDENDIANYTNRSPYPTLHLLRADDMARVLAKYPNPESIPERNIEYVRKMGIEALEGLLKECLTEYNEA